MRYIHYGKGGNSMEIPRTTLCYISKGDKWLFIHKTRKNDHNKDKYLGIGGHIEKDETPMECIIREIKEETGIEAASSLKNLEQKGTVMFHSDKYGDEEMNVFSADYVGDGKEILNGCDEGNLIWIPKSDAYKLPIWEGDKLIFDELIAQEAFEMGLFYEGEKLVNYVIKKL